MLFNDGDRLLFIGDSVTDMGRAHPIGEGMGDGLGVGYVRAVHSLLNAVYPELRVKIMNLGISGNTVRSLADRWQRDCIDLKPDWVCVLIGINDVWRQFDMPNDPEYSVMPEEYESTLRSLLERTYSELPSLKGMFLISPFFVENITQDPMRARMGEYADIMRRVANDYKAIYVDVQSMFDRYLQHRHSSSICWDRVHPNLVGGMLMAREFLAAAGFDHSHIS